MLAVIVGSMAIGSAPSIEPWKEKGGALYILTIGIDQYGEAGPKLPHAYRDASDLAAAFSGGMRRSHGRVFTKVLVREQASRAGISAAFHELAQSTTGNDTFVFFYAGHGARVSADGEEEFALIPAGRGEAISTTAFLSLLRQVQARNKLVMIDSLYDAVLPDEGGAAELEGGATVAAASGANVVVLGTDASAPAKESEPHGALATALLAVLGAGGPTGTTAHELATRAAARLREDGERVLRQSTLGADFVVTGPRTQIAGSPGCVGTCAPGIMPHAAVEATPPEIVVDPGLKIADGVVVAPAGPLAIKGRVSSKRYRVASLTLNGAEQGVSDTGSFDATVTVEPEPRRVELIATDSAGNASRTVLTVQAEHEPGSDRGAQVVVEPPGRPEAPVGGKPRHYALVFATDEYSEWSRLRNPIFDGTTVAARLRDLYGFETEVVRNPDVATLVETILRYQDKQYGPMDELLVFFAGHGVYAERWRDGFLVGRTSPGQVNARTFNAFLQHGTLFKLIDRIRCEHILLVIDACFGGQAIDPAATVVGMAAPPAQGARLDARSRLGVGPLLALSSLATAQVRAAGDEYAPVSREELVRRKLRGRTRNLLTSGGKEYVPDGRPGQHSPFARALIRALDSKGGEDGLLTTDEMYGFLEKATPEPRRARFTADSTGDFVFLAIARR